MLHSPSTYTTFTAQEELSVLMAVSIRIVAADKVIVFCEKRSAQMSDV